MQKHLHLKTAAVEKSTHQDFFNIAISVDCVILGYEEKQLKVLLIKSDLKEFEHLWSLLGDFELRHDTAGNMTDTITIGGDQSVIGAQGRFNF